MMRVVDGKMLNFLALPDGKFVSPHVPKKALLFVRGILRFQIVQHTFDELDALYVHHRTRTKTLLYRLRTTYFPSSVPVYVVCNAGVEYL